MCFIYHTGNSGLSTVAVAVIASAMTFTLLIVTVIITFIMTYVCVKRTFDKANAHYPKHQSPGPQEMVLYEQVGPTNQTITKVDVELQPNPAYGTSHKVIMDTNPVYDSCK